MNTLPVLATPQLHIVPDALQPAHPQPVNRPTQTTAASDDFWEIWLEHRDYVYRVCLKCTGSDQAEANELLSQARDKAQAKWPKHAHKVTNPKSWLSSLTKHLYIDLYRAQERKNKVHSGLQKEAWGAIANQPSPESNLLGNELKAYMQQLIIALPPKLRTAVILRFHQEKSYKEIAFQLILSEATVRKRIQQARQQLRKPLRRYLAGLSSTAIVTESAALQDLTLWIDPVTPIQNAGPTQQPTQNVGHPFSQTQTASIAYGVTATCLETLPSVQSQSLLPTA